MVMFKIRLGRSSRRRAHFSANHSKPLELSSQYHPTFGVVLAIKWLVVSNCSSAASVNFGRKIRVNFSRTLRIVPATRLDDRSLHF